MIDPQTQANNWIKKTYGDDLKVLKLSTNKFAGIMEGALRNGFDVLIEDCPEIIDAALDTVLTKAVFINEGIKTIKYSDKDVAYDDLFSLNLTSKMPNPHFLPEICIKLTIINFTVTFEGLEEQLLGDVVVQERPEVEQQRQELAINLAKFKAEITSLEIKILRELSNSDPDTILDTDDLIDILEISKDKSKSIKDQLDEALIIEANVDHARNTYKSISERGSVLYFVIADLAGIDPMYQYSLTYVKKLFNRSIAQSEKTEDVDKRLEILLNAVTFTLFTNISRGLFEAHKLIFSFLIITSIQRRNKIIAVEPWNVFLRGAGIFDNTMQPDNPNPNFMNALKWDTLYVLGTWLEESNKEIKGFVASLTDKKEEWEAYGGNENILEMRVPCGFHSFMHPFQVMVLQKIFRPDKLLFAIGDYVKEQIGKEFAEAPPCTMEELYNDSDNVTPVIFVLSAGADPSLQLMNFADLKGFSGEKIRYTSLGQGQDVRAEGFIKEGKEEGKWILLQNCHLYKSWMIKLEQMVSAFPDEADEIHVDFRLFLTSMPATYFPVSILQNGLKLTTEPPRGLKANLKRSYNEITEESFKDCTKFDEWKKLLFGICFFHAVVQERRKYGALGFNIRYDFNDSDLETSQVMLRSFLNDQEEIPWDAMNYMMGHINYGGRVTDDWDRTLLMNLLKRFFSTDNLEDGYTFSESGKYFVPDFATLKEYRTFINDLPSTEAPEIFGLNSNANIVYMQQESLKIVGTILDIQPRVTGGGGGKSSDEIIQELVLSLEEICPALLDLHDHKKDLFKTNSQGLMHCLSTVLCQEIERFNKLLMKIKSSLRSLDDAI